MDRKNRVASRSNVGGREPAHAMIANRVYEFDNMGSHRNNINSSHFLTRPLLLRLSLSPPTMSNIFSIFRRAPKPETSSPQQSRPTLLQPFPSKPSPSLLRSFPPFFRSSSLPSRPSHHLSRRSRISISPPLSPTLASTQTSLLDSPAYYNALAMGKPHLYDPSINQLERTGLVLTDARSFQLDPPQGRPRPKPRS